MAWEILISEDVIKFVESLPGKLRRIIKNKLKRFFKEIREKGHIPFSGYDIRRLKSADAFRLRIGKIRFIFEINFEEKVIKLVHADFRGKIYKGRIK